MYWPFRLKLRHQLTHNRNDASNLGQGCFAGALVEMASTWRTVPPQRNRTATLLDQKINAAIDLREAFDSNNVASFDVEVKRREKLDKIDKLELSLEAISPHGTKSVILDKRPNDKS